MTDLLITRTDIDFLINAERAAALLRVTELELSATGADLGLAPWRTIARGAPTRYRLSDVLDTIERHGIGGAS